MEIEIGRGKKARRAYGFDDIAIVPSRRTRDAEDVDIGWKLGPYLVELPLLASAMDGVVSPSTAIALGRMGGIGVLNLEGIWGRYDDAGKQLEEIAALEKGEATRRMQEIYQEPVKPDLMAQRVREIKAAGVLAAASLTPQRVRQNYEAVLEAGPRHPRHPGHGGLRRARLDGGRAAQPEGVHLRAAGARDRRRLCQLPDGAAPDAHRCRRRAGRRRPGRRVHHARRARRRRPAGDGHRRRRRRAHPAPDRDRAVLQRDRRRRHAHRRRHRQGDRLRRRRRDGRLAARPGPRGARPGLPLGHGHLPPDAPARRPREDQPGGHAARRSCSARPARTTGRST